MPSPITTHVLDTARGRPAEGVPAVLEVRRGASFQEIGRGVTNADGRIADLLPRDAKLEKTAYRLIFDTGAYFGKNGGQGFYPAVSILFEVRDLARHYHVPLLLSPYGYSTYRGS